MNQQYSHLLVLIEKKFKNVPCFGFSINSVLDMEMGYRSASSLAFFACLLLLVQSQPPVCSHCNCSYTSENAADVLCLSDIKGFADLLFENEAKTNNSTESDHVVGLTVRNNELTDLKRNFSMRNAVTLDLSFNKIARIGDGVFSNLQKLEKLVLSHNNIEDLKPDAFKGQYMAGQYYPLRSLRTLMLDYNSIRTLNEDLFEHIESIETLSLASNPLEVIDKHTAIAITNLLNLTFLDLSYTQLNSLPRYFLHTPKLLKVFNLSGNSFTRIPQELEEAHSLETFVFNDNAVVELTKENGFPTMPTLRVLHLCSMYSLVSIGPGSLANLTNLRELYIASNPKLTRIDDGALATTDAEGTRETWPAIKKLYINDNQISYINRSFLANWDHLAELDLLGNPWTCECENQWIVETLTPIYLKIDRENATKMRCAAPIEMASFTFEELYRRNYNMRCLDLYGAQPERDAVIIVGMLAGLLLGIPLMLFCVYSYRRHWFGYFDDSPAAYSRQFYSRTSDVFEY